MIPVRAPVDPTTGAVPSASRGQAGGGARQPAVDDRPAPRPGERAQARAAVLAERLVGGDRRGVGRVLDPLALGAAAVGEHELVAGSRMPRARSPSTARVPLVGRPRAGRRQDRAGHLAGRDVGDRGLEPGEPGAHERGDVAVAAVLAQQGLRVPEHEVVVGRARRARRARRRAGGPRGARTRSRRRGARARPPRRARVMPIASGSERRSARVGRAEAGGEDLRRRRPLPCRGDRAPGRASGRKL